MELKKLIKNKRGDVTDIVVFMIVVATLAISFIVVIYANNEIRSVISDTALNESPSADSILSSFENLNNNTTQNGFIFMFAIFIVAIMLSAFLVRFHPAFIFLYILILGITIFVSLYLSAVYDIFEESPIFSSITSQQSKISFVMNNFEFIILAVGILSMIVAFAKLPGQTFGIEGGSDI